MKKLLSTIIFSLFTIPLICFEGALDETLSRCFPDVSKTEIKITELKGGFSQASLYKIEVANKIYVLRVLQCLEVNNQDELELFCMIEAAKKGISPQIIFVSPDRKTIVMEFVEGKTLTIEQANDPENIIRMAKSIHTAHQITEHEMEGLSLLSKAMQCFSIILQELAPKDEIIQAYHLVETLTQKLSTFNISKVLIHGDLNPRNIFIKNSQVFLIDWAETTMEDPFYDLAYFSLKSSLSQKNERFLLQSYLQHSPSQEELIRFQLHKRIHHAFWSLTDLYLANLELEKHPEQQIDQNHPLQSWKSYQKSFADMENLSAQYFYDLSRLNYKLALEEI